MSSASATPKGLHAVPESPVPGLALSERRVSEPRATLVCVHGGLDRGGSFAPLARRSDTFDVVAYDRRGYQGSRGVQPLTLDGHVDDLLAIARDEARRGPVILFGHSFGGVVTFAAACRAPDVASMVINYESPLPWVLAREPQRAAPVGDPGEEAEMFFRRIMSDAAWERLSDDERQSRRLDGSALLADLTVLHSDPPFDVADITTASAYIHGDAGNVEYYRQLSMKIELLNPTMHTVEMAKSGHGAHLSSPDQLAAVIADLWSRQCASV